MFYGYVALASKLYGQEKWQDLLLEALSNVDFSNKNEMFKQLNVDKSIIMKKQIKALEEYFDGLVTIKDEEVAVENENNEVAMI